MCASLATVTRSEETSHASVADSGRAGPASDGRLRAKRLSTAPEGVWISMAEEKPKEARSVCDHTAKASSSRPGGAGPGGVSSRTLMPSICRSVSRSTNCRHWPWRTTAGA
ncbi:MAG: hypothetical protein DMF81_16280 [Acidobacteria bacterium]|nr:MAG: hypothetical protein DMF81_16280 [Acidobacteriota bacterium]